MTSAPSPSSPATGSEHETAREGLWQRHFSEGRWIFNFGILALAGAGVAASLVTLLWDNANDEDLFVTDPTGYQLWYGDRGPSPIGGELDRDDNVYQCGSDLEPGGVENIFWPQSTSPAHGTYVVRINEYGSCGTPANWTAEVRINGELVARESGSANGFFTFTY